MQQFEYTIQDPLGFTSLCTITKGDQTKKLTQLMMLMNMGIKVGDRVTVRAEGADEEAAIAALKTFFEKNL